MIDARRRHDGVCGVRPGAGAYGAGGEDDEGVDEHGGFVFLNTDWHGLNGGGLGSKRSAFDGVKSFVNLIEIVGGLS